MKYLVTGGGGFLGRHIVDKLLARGVQVRVLGRRKYPDLEKCGVECVTADLADKAAVRDACADIDGVFHVASKTGIAGRYKDYFKSNVTGTRNIVAGCRAGGVKKLVYTSTPSVVYGREPIINGNEDLPYPPVYLTAYAQTKAEAEAIALEADGAANLFTCALRPHLIWGPGDTNLIPRIVEKARAGKLMRVGGGDNLVSVSYVENCADAHLMACDRLEKGADVCGKAYFINEPEPVNCWGFITQILQTLGVDTQLKQISLKSAYRIGTLLDFAGVLAPNWEPPMTRFLALQLATSHYFDITRAREDIGWQPEISIDEGLARMAQAYKLVNS